MELRQYGYIVWKRVWIIVALLVIVLIGSLALRVKPAPYRVGGGHPRFDGGRETAPHLDRAHHLG
jgi:hypothetical protein